MAARDLLDLVLPARCVGCRELGSVLCPRCHEQVRPVQVPSGDDLIVRAAGPYEDALRSAVLAYKERGRRDLAPVLARLLSAEVSAAARDWRGPIGLVPIPSAPAAARARGGQHVLRLARLIVRDLDRLDFAVLPSGLRVQRDVRDSAGLSIQARHANLAGALRAQSGPVGMGAVLLDDVLTTGATLTEAARALRVAGWPVLGAAVIAATPRYFPAFAARPPRR